MAAETSSPTPLPEMKTTSFPSNGQLLVEETDDLLKASLAAMRADIAATPAWSGAPPSEDEFLLMFLRAEVFSPSRAADRYRKFWEVKVELCGEDKAAQPIRAGDVKEALDLQFFQMIPGGKDVEGRQIILVIPGNNDKKMDNKLRIRAAWYVLLAALEDVEVQRRGFCFVGLANTVKFSQIDPNFTKTLLGSIQGVLPVRVGSMNICHPPSFFRVVWGLISVVLHKRIKKRIKILPGTDSDIREALRSMISPDNLPIPIGTKTLDFATWTENRIKAEAIKTTA